MRRKIDNQQIAGICRESIKNKYVDLFQSIETLRNALKLKDIDAIEQAISLQKDLLNEIDALKELTEFDINSQFGKDILLAIRSNIIKDLHRLKNKNSQNMFIIRKCLLLINRVLKRVTPGPVGQKMAYSRFGKSSRRSSRGRMNVKA
jgi:hypothetical protein